MFLFFPSGGPKAPWERGRTVLLFPPSRPPALRLAPIPTPRGVVLEAWGWTSHRRGESRKWDVEPREVPALITPFCLFPVASHEGPEKAAEESKWGVHEGRKNLKCGPRPPQDSHGGGHPNGPQGPQKAPGRPPEEQLSPVPLPQKLHNPRHARAVAWHLPRQSKTNKRK